jgi:hypothetical protein
MFDPKTWIQKSWKDEDAKTVKIGGEEVRIKRLTGTQWEQYVRAVQGKSEDSPVPVVLQAGLVKGFGQYTYEEMVKFYDACPVLADKIAQEVLQYTAQRMDAEAKVLEEAEKNSEATTTASPSGDGAESTDKTHSEQ